MRSGETMTNARKINLLKGLRGAAAASADASADHRPAAVAAESTEDRHYADDDDRVERLDVGGAGDRAASWRDDQSGVRHLYR
jgi:hypothetical protein